jgi:hypothetical protein
MSSNAERVKARVDGDSRRVAIAQIVPGWLEAFEVAPSADQAP